MGGKSLRLHEGRPEENAYLAMLNLHFSLACLFLFSLILTQEDHQNSQQLNLDFGFLQARLDNILKSELFRAVGRFQLFNVADSLVHWPRSYVSTPLPVFASWASTPLPVNALTCFGCHGNTLLQASDSVSCHGLHKALCFIEACNTWPPSVSTYSSNNTPFECDVCCVFTHLLHPCFVYFFQWQNENV